MAPAVDVAKIQKAARTSLPLTIKTFKMNHETEEYLETILFHFLKEFVSAGTDSSDFLLYA